MALIDKLTAIADAIRAKTGETDKLTLDGMVTAIDSFSGDVSTIGELEVGDIVSLLYGGEKVEFIVVHQGNPDASLYDSSCNGTWLLTKDVIGDGRYWHYNNNNGKNDYKNSDIHKDLLNLHTYFGSSIQNFIKQVKIPYRDGAGSSMIVASGSSGLSTHAFLLSYTEVGFSGDSLVPVDGAVLDYFKDAEDAKRVAKRDDGNSVYWWLRTPHASGEYYVCTVSGSGLASKNDVVGRNYLRFAMILDPSAPISGKIHVVE